MKKVLSSLFVVACSLLLMGVGVSPVLAGDVIVTKPVKQKVQVKPEVTKGLGKSRSCEEVKSALTAKAEKLLMKAELFKAEYDKAAEANEHNIDADLLSRKQAAVTAAIAAAKEDLALLSCPVAKLKTTMKQLEQDLQYVNTSLSDYRRTLKGLKGKVERKNVVPTKPVLGKQACTVSQVTTKKQAMTKLTTSAEKLAATYASKTKTSGALSNAIVRTKRLAFESAIRKAKQDVTELVCENGSMEKGVKTFKTDMQTALTALKAYRQSLLDVAPDKTQTTLEKEVSSLSIVN